MAIRLASFRVYGLFGIYDNKIELNVEERVTAVIGPNGRGKTVCLRMIEAFYKMRHRYFSSIEFDTCIFSFVDGSTVEVRRERSQDTLFPEVHQSNDRGQGSILYRINRPGWEPISWQPGKGSLREIKFFKKYLPFLSKMTGDKWLDERSGRVVDTDHLLEYYGEYLPVGAKNSKDIAFEEALKDIIEDVDCHLVETQRLLTFSDESSPEFRYGGRIGAEPELVVEQKAERLRELLFRQLEVYASLSQRLDRSFPRRVIGVRRKRKWSFEDVVTRFANLERQRRELQQYGLIDTEFEAMTFPHEIDEEVVKLLSVYVDDTEEKLNVFADLKLKISIFIDILNSRFVDKYVKVDRDSGFKVFSSHLDREIDLKKLSSGEQHQLVLVFELIFEIQKDSLILIDEPELSLHVVWQKKFISDLLSIIKINEFDVIIATHSPQLIGRWSRFAVQLGSVEG